MGQLQQTAGETNAHVEQSCGAQPEDNDVNGDRPHPRSLLAFCALLVTAHAVRSCRPQSRLKAGIAIGRREDRADPRRE
jgi:hypothetical protein